MENEELDADMVLHDVGGVSEVVSADVDEIESQTSAAVALYDDIIERANRGVPEEVQWDFGADETSLAEVGVEDTTVALTNEVEQDLQEVENPQTVSFDSETVGEYVEDITSRIQEVRTVRSELESRINSAEELSQQAFSDFVDSTQLLESYDDPSTALEGNWGEKLDEHLTVREGSEETRRAIEDMTVTLRSEENALGNELANVVNSYVSAAYDRATDLSEELGGHHRPYVGEVDLLGQIADSRAQIIDSRGDPDDYEFVPPELAAQTALMDASKEAMESQAALVAQMSSQLGDALEEVYDMVEEAEGYVNQSEDLQPSYGSLRAMREGFGEMGNIAEDECYDTFAEAVRSVMRRGMTDDEEFDDEYSFAMDDIPHIGSSELAGGEP